MHSRARPLSPLLLARQVVGDALLSGGDDGAVRVWSLAGPPSKWRYAGARASACDGGSRANGRARLRARKPLSLIIGKTRRREYAADAGGVLMMPQCRLRRTG